MSLANLDFQNSPQHPQGRHKSKPKSSELYSLDVVDLIRRKFWIILFFILLSSGLSVLYYFKAPKTYESTAKIFIDEKSAPSVNSADRDSFSAETSIEKYLQTLKSTLILEPAIERGRFYDMNLFRDCDDILYKLREKKVFAVKPADTKSNSGVIKLVFRGDTKDECQKVLHSIVDSFGRHIKSTTKDLGGENAVIVQKLQNEWLSRLKQVEEEIKVLSVSPELVTVDGRATDPHQMQLSLMHQDLHDLRSERNKINARIQNVKRDLASGKSSEDLVSEIIAEQSDVSDGAYARVQDQMVQLKVEEQELLNQYGGDHPQLKAIRRKINAVSQMRAEELASIRSGNRNGGVQPDLVTTFLKMMDRKVDLLLSEESQIEQQIKAIQLKSTSVSATLEKMNALKRERDRLETGYAAVIERMSEMNALKEHLWRNLSILDPPSVGEIVAPELSVCLAAGVFLGSLLGLGFAGFKDIAEKTFHSSDDVGTLLDTPVIGHISFFQKSRKKKRNSNYPGIESELIAIHAPASQISEAYRAIRTTVFFKAQENKAKIIQVTSPTPGDGKSTTISNLAASIAQSGRKVLLIDADLRKPTQHKLFGVDNDAGLSSVISGEKAFNEVVKTVIPDFLSIVCAGPIPANPAELLTSPGFAKTINAYRDQYDFVLIDTPPVLAVTDPSIVCAHADMVYMVMRIRNGVRTNSLRAKEVINTMGIQLCGVIINGVRRKDERTYAYSNQYGYGTYGYGQNSNTLHQQRNGTTPSFVPMPKHRENPKSRAS